MNFTYFLFILCAYLSSQSESRFCSDDILKLCRRMMGKELDGLSLKELQQLENQLSDGMQSVKDKKVLRSNTNSGVIGCINLRCHLLNPYLIFYSFVVNMVRLRHYCIANSCILILKKTFSERKMKKNFDMTKLILI